MNSSDIIILQMSLVPMYFYLGASATVLVHVFGVNGAAAILYLCAGSYAYSQAYQHIYQFQGDTSVTGLQSSVGSSDAIQ
jgi:hypothetical protein